MLSDEGGSGGARRPKLPEGQCNHSLVHVARGAQNCVRGSAITAWCVPTVLNLEKNVVFFHYSKGSFRPSYPVILNYVFRQTFASRVAN